MKLSNQSPTHPMFCQALRCRNIPRDALPRHTNPRDPLPSPLPRTSTGATPPPSFPFPPTREGRREPPGRLASQACVAGPGPQPTAPTVSRPQPRPAIRVGDACRRCCVRLASAMTFARDRAWRARLLARARAVCATPGFARSPPQERGRAGAEGPAMDSDERRRRRRE